MGGKARRTGEAERKTDRPTKRADGVTDGEPAGGPKKDGKARSSFSGRQEKNKGRPILAGRPGEARKQEREQASKPRPKQTGRPRNQDNEPEQTERETRKTHRKGGGRSMLLCEC